MLCWVDEHDSICELCNNIFSTTDKITDFIKESDIPNKPDLLYDTKKCQWACHSIRHVQQNKAKLDALHYGSGTTAKMYFQCDLEKVSQATLVRRVCLSMQTSFWWNKIALLRKKTYFTTSYGCDWDPKDSLSIAEYVWNNFQMTLFGCYLGNPYPKLL